MSVWFRRRAVPAAIATLLLSAAVVPATPAAADNSSLSVWSWGSNLYGTLADPTVAGPLVVAPAQVGGDTDWKSISVGGEATESDVFALKRNGSLWGWGDNTYGQLGDGTTTPRSFPQQIGSDVDWASVVTSIDQSTNDHTFAIKTNHTLWGGA